jgi:glucose-6-phosphate isomerase
MNKIIKLKEWQALAAHHQIIKDQHMRDWFEKDEQRFSRFHLQTGEILFDYSRNRITEKTIPLLCQLAEAVNLRDKIESLFAGEPINITENRPALHTALRDSSHRKIIVNGENIADLITHTQQRMRAFVSSIHEGKQTGITGKPIRHIVNIGIGGSHLGPMMCTHALKEFALGNLDIHFISSVDEDQLVSVLQKIDPETSLFIISSKSFSTIEPLTNARTLSDWLKNKLGNDAIKKHFIAITANKQKAEEFGITEENIFPLWDWVGGRYSIWSAIGLPLMLMIGNDQFADFLEGAYETDQHFRNSEFSQNLPVIMALLGIWYVNFFGATAQAIAPYASRLRYLIPYLQQAEMESNGKCTDKNAEKIPYASGSIIFGEEGCDSQHSYLQLLHQGQHLIPVDFIMAGNPTSHTVHQDILIASCLSQAKALMRGITIEEAHDDLIAAQYPSEKARLLAPHKMVPGNKPNNILFLDRINPHNLGALIALYEHKIFVQSVIWNINAFDQWGVELGKQLLPTILNHVQNETCSESIDSATAGLIRHLKKIKAAS